MKTAGLRISPTPQGYLAVVEEDGWLVKSSLESKSLAGAMAWGLAEVESVIRAELRRVEKEKV